MDRDVFVQNVEHLCKVRGVYPTVACRESGAGNSFISDVKRGRIPSIEKFQMLATYLGVTTSELLGEELPPNSDNAEKTVPPKGSITDLEQATLDKLRRANEDDRIAIEAILRKYK